MKIDTSFDICFCDPRSPWQRGITNGLLRGAFGE